MGDSTEKPTTPSQVEFTAETGDQASGEKPCKIVSKIPVPVAAFKPISAGSQLAEGGKEEDDDTTKMGRARERGSSKVRSVSSKTRTGRRESSANKGSGLAQRPPYTATGKVSTQTKVATLESRFKLQLKKYKDLLMEMKNVEHKWYTNKVKLEELKDTLTAENGKSPGEIPELQLSVLAPCEGPEGDVIKALRDKVITLESENMALAKKATSLKEFYETQNFSMKNLKNEMVELRNNFKEQDNDINNSRGRQEMLAERIQKFAISLTDMNVVVTQLLKKQSELKCSTDAELERDLEAARREKIELQNNCNSLLENISNLEEELEHLRPMKSLLEEKKSDLKKMEFELCSTKAELNSCQERLQQLEEEMKETSAELDTKGSEVSALRSQLEDILYIKRLDDSKQFDVVEILNQNEPMVLKQAIVQAQTTLNQLLESKESLEEKVDRLETEVVDLKKERCSEMKEHCRTIAKLKRKNSDNLVQVYKLIQSLPSKEEIRSEHLAEIRSLHEDEEEGYSYDKMMGVLRRKIASLELMERRLKQLETAHSICTKRRINNEKSIAELEKKTIMRTTSSSFLRDICEYYFVKQPLMTRNNLDQ